MIKSSKTRRIIIQILAPEFFCTIIGVIVGIVTFDKGSNRDFLYNLGFWIVNVNAGAVAHQISWLFFLSFFRQENRESLVTIKKIWKPTVPGILLTFVFVFFLNEGYSLSPEAVLVMLIQVIAICIVVHVFLFQFKFYKAINELKQPEAQAPGSSESSADPSLLHKEVEEFLSLTIDERIEKVDLRLVSHIKVEDHYCTVIYFNNEECKQWTVYSKLKSFEDQYPTRLVRINRSVLANPDMVEKVEKSNGKYLITMKGDPDIPFSLSASQKHLLDKLVPVVC
ncbi:LytTR family transcriptional regulator [bacterium]|nr:LytTR family transcriptional regulator [bacterium]